MRVNLINLILNTKAASFGSQPSLVPPKGEKPQKGKRKGKCFVGKKSQRTLFPIMSIRQIKKIKVQTIFKSLNL